jgi:hypothetical protein
MLDKNCTLPGAHGLRHRQSLVLCKGLYKRLPGLSFLLVTTRHQRAFLEPETPSGTGFALKTPRRNKGKVPRRADAHEVLDFPPKRAWNANSVCGRTSPAASKNKMVPQVPQSKKVGWMRVFLFRLRKTGGIGLPTVSVIRMVFAVAFGAGKLPGATPVTAKVDL